MNQQCPDSACNYIVTVQFWGHLSCCHSLIDVLQDQSDASNAKEKEGPVEEAIVVFQAWAERQDKYVITCIKGILH